MTLDTNDDIAQSLIGTNKTASLYWTYEISFFNTPEFFKIGQKHFRFDENNA